MKQTVSSQKLMQWKRVNHFSSWAQRGNALRSFFKKKTKTETRPQRLAIGWRVTWPSGSWLGRWVKVFCGRVGGKRIECWKRGGGTVSRVETWPWPWTLATTCSSSTYPEVHTWQSEADMPIVRPLATHVGWPRRANSSTQCLHPPGLFIPPFQSWTIITHKHHLLSLQVICNSGQLLCIPSSSSSAPSLSVAKKTDRAAGGFPRSP